MKKILLVIMLFTTAFISFTFVFGDSLSQESQFNNIVVFIRFNDEETYTAPFSYDHYDDMLNGVDQISLRDYYLEASYGNLTIDSYIPNDNETIIFYTDIYDRNYYEPYSVENPQGVRENEQGSREHDLIQRALNFIDDENLVPDEMDLDVNEDGMLDSLTLMVSGEDTGWNSLLWPHKWELYSFYSETYGFESDAPSINGVPAYTYTFELLGNDQYYDYQVDVGVLAHETFHLLGAPDLYHYYEYLDIEPVGSWGLMEYNGNIPSHMLGYMKEEYAGWMPEPTEIIDSGSYTLYPMQDDPSNMYKIYTGFTNEWIYLEYRDSDGLYESNLPDSGLIVYRVNQNVIGNEEGSYDSSGNSTDEVFVFRPGLSDQSDPIILIDGSGDIDGNVDNGALSNNNYYDSAGIGTAIPIFTGDGTILNIYISNVVEANGYVTFDVFLEPQISLVSEDFSLRGKDVILYDSYLMEYEVQFNNIPDDLDAYYTIDGTTPTRFSTLYNGEIISIDSLHNNVKVALYNGANLIGITEQEFVFNTMIESDHTPYGNELQKYYYFNFGDEISYGLDFDNRSELELDYDYVRLYVDDFYQEFTGIDMQDFYQEFYSSEFLLEFDTDEYVDDYFGFDLEIIPSEGINLIVSGSLELTSSVNETYVDFGATLVGVAIDDYTLTIYNTVDETHLGTYTVTYVVKDEFNEVVIEEVRIVHIVDDIAPVVTLNGEYEMIIEAGSDFVDPFITYSDNFDEYLDVEVEGNVDTSRLNSNILIYTVTDDSGNVTVLKRIVTVVDTVAPTVVLNPGVDTLLVGDEWIDGGVFGLDNLTTNFDIEVEGEVDIDTPGTYEVVYTLYDSSDNFVTISRFVTVMDATNEMPEFICSKMVTTLSTDQQFVLRPCYADGEMMEVDKTDMSMTAGIHELVYFIEIDNVRYVHRVYVYVYQEGTSINEVAMIERRDEE